MAVLCRFCRSYYIHTEAATPTLLHSLTLSIHSLIYIDGGGAILIPPVAQFWHHKWRNFGTTYRYLSKSTMCMTVAPFLFEYETMSFFSFRIFRLLMIVFRLIPVASSRFLVEAMRLPLSTGSPSTTLSFLEALRRQWM